MKRRAENWTHAFPVHCVLQGDVEVPGLLRLQASTPHPRGKAKIYIVTGISTAFSFYRQGLFCFF